MVPFDAFFEEFATLVGTTATAHGFTPAEEAVAVGRFGSRLAAFRRGPETLRLVWDGREHWLALEYKPVPEYNPALEWTGLLNDRYDGRCVSPNDHARLREGLERALASVWHRRTVAPVPQ